MIENEELQFLDEIERYEWVRKPKRLNSLSFDTNLYNIIFI